MARDARRHDRSGVAPGRGKPRPRATSRSTASATRSGKAADHGTAVEEPRGLAVKTLFGGVHVTRRAIAFGLVLALLIFSYVGSLQVYLKQEHDVGMYQQQINDNNATIADLQDQLDRWNHPDYVQAQARTRLGWVFPGETAYVVIGPDGKPVEGSNQLNASQHQATANMTWWQRLWDSIFTADQPGPRSNPAAGPVTPPAEPASPEASPHR